MFEIVLPVLMFTGAFGLLATAEWRWPLRLPGPTVWPRRLHNLMLFVCGAIILRLVVPFSLTSAAFFAQLQTLGLFNLISLRFGIAFVLSLLLLDLTMYWQHRVMHRIEWLWRLHRVHHSDEMLDVSTGIRFHPLEMLFSLGIKCAVVIALGVPPAAALSFAIALNLSSLFTHSNVRLPAALEQLLGWIIITPALHWLHHSRQVSHSRSNFGFFLSLWDRLFVSFCTCSSRQAGTLSLGVDGFAGHSLNLLALLRQPFLSPPAGAARYTGEVPKKMV